VLIEINLQNYLNKKFMRKNIFTIAIIAIIFVLSSCEKNEVALNKPDATKALTQEQQKMRIALEKTTNILLDMISNDQTYFEQLNKVIVAGSPEYLEDRVMLKDLFSKTSNSSTLRVKANSNKFDLDFKTAFSNNKPQKVGRIEGVNGAIFSNPDSLIQFLTENNVSIYCPFPIEEYEKDNQIPTITFDPIDNDSANIGYLFDKQSGYSVVKVNQEYNDLKPVWILKPYEKKANRIESDFSSKIKKSPSVNLNDTVFEIKLGQIFCKDYCCNFFEGDLEIKVLRSLTTSTIDPITWKASGSYSNAISINLERKYVTYARKNDERGWVTINAVFDSNWSRDKTQQVFAVYEQDPTGDVKISGTAKFTLSADVSVKDTSSGATLTLKKGHEVGATCEGTFKCNNDLLGVLEMNRNWLFRTISIDNGNYYKGSAFRNGCGIQALSQNFWFTMQKREL
jgi:hypothetical protein